MAEHKSLKEHLGTDPQRSQVVEDCARLVDDEVKRKRGMSGTAIKLGYKTVKAIKPGFITGAIDGLLDDWLVELEPFYQSWRASSGELSEFLTARSDEVAEAMLSVTDQRAEHAESKTAKKMYGKLRGSAKENVVEAIPALGALLQRHL